jgi:ketosteroid isomerase-like protein
VATQRVDIVRRACEAWGEGDLSTISDLYAADLTADGGELWPEGRGTVHGRDAVLSAFDSIMKAFEVSELIPEGFLEAGDTLVVPLLWRGRLPGSESFVEQRLIGSYGFRGEQIAEIRWFASMERTLDALGLPPDSAARVIREPIDGQAQAG